MRQYEQAILAMSISIRLLIVASALTAAGTLCGAASARAQQPGGPGLPRVFVGGGIAAATGDAASRMRLVAADPSRVWLLEAGFGAGSRVGVGIELAQPGSVSAATSGETFHESGTQTERALLAIVRARLVASTRWALDAVGGGGVLFQHHERRAAPCYRGCAESIVESLSRRAPAFVLGADLPIRIVPHVWMVGVGRLYVLRRGAHISEVPSRLIPWQFEWKSSSRLAVGVTGRIGW